MLVYLIRLADVYSIDVVDAALIKFERNEARYPSDLSRGSSAKYTDLHRRGPGSDG